MARNATISTDGKSSVDQGGYFPQQSVGSKTSHCDLDTVLNWWGTTRPVDPAPEPIPLDEHGVPYRQCLKCGVYVKPSGFARDASRKSGYDPYCRECRHQQYVQAKVEKVRRAK